MAKLLFFAGLLSLACMAQAARLPADALSMLESLPQSMMGMQGAAKQQDSNEDTSAAAQVVGNMMASAAHGDLEVRCAIGHVAANSLRSLHAELARSCGLHVLQTSPTHGLNFWLPVKPPLAPHLNCMPGKINTFFCFYSSSR